MINQKKRDIFKIKKIIIFVGNEMEIFELSMDEKFICSKKEVKAKRFKNIKSIFLNHKITKGWTIIYLRRKKILNLIFHLKKIINHYIYFLMKENYLPILNQKNWNLMTCKMDIIIFFNKIYIWFNKINSKENQFTLLFFCSKS